MPETGCNVMSVILGFTVYAVVSPYQRLIVLIMYAVKNSSVIFHVFCYNQFMKSHPEESDYCQ